jgi:hypothetical protein
MERVERSCNDQVRRFGESHRYYHSLRQAGIVNEFGEKAIASDSLRIAPLDLSQIDPQGNGARRPVLAAISALRAASTIGRSARDIRR